MAYSKLAQLPVQYGLYTSFIGALVYWVFGTSKDINIGPVAVASIVTGNIVVEIQRQLPDMAEAPEVIAGVLAMLCGAAICAIALLRLGWIVDLISLPAVCAFISGSAITICVGQIPVLFGIRGLSAREPVYRMVINIFQNLHRTSFDCVIGITGVLILQAIKSYCDYAAKKHKSKTRLFFFISSLRTVFVIITFTLMSFLVNRSHKNEPTFRLLGFIPRGELRLSNELMFLSY
jgi:sodium-independent sulfate anion transporter 11